MAEEIIWTLFFLALAFIANWLAVKNRFYHYEWDSRSPIHLELKNVLTVFAIYLGATFFLPRVLLRMLAPFSDLAEKKASLLTPATLQIVVFAFMIFFLFLYCSSLKRTDMRRVWKDRSAPPTRSIAYDFGFGAMSWAVAFPLVAAIGQLSDLILFWIFGIQHYEQVAVRYLNFSLASPSLLLVALFMIVCAAPIIEEFLFRGILQTWLKTRLGSKAAILTSALCFSLFHMASSQGIGNISLVLSLFTLACFLGFVYERQGSLFASIGLHMAFNTFSALRILFLPSG